jgi:hypothetical protein
MGHDAFVYLTEPYWARSGCVDPSFVRTASTMEMTMLMGIVPVSRCDHLLTIQDEVRATLKLLLVFEDGSDYPRSN